MRYVINPATAQWRIVDGEAVVVNVESSYYYGLNRTGTFVWRALSEAPRSAADLAADLSGAFHIDLARARADIDSLLQELSRENLVTES
jgi:hypothetical protein